MSEDTCRQCWKFIFCKVMPPEDFAKCNLFEREMPVEIREYLEKRGVLSASDAQFPR